MAKARSFAVGFLWPWAVGTGAGMLASALGGSGVWATVCGCLLGSALLSRREVRRG